MLSKQVMRIIAEEVRQLQYYKDKMHFSKLFANVGSSWPGEWGFWVAIRHAAAHRGHARRKIGGRTGGIVNAM